MGEAEEDPQPVGNWYRLLVSLYTMACSSAMIMYNKWLLQKDHFPYASALTCMHMMTGFLFALTMLALRPKLFWGLESVKHAETGIIRTVVTLFMPLGMLYAGNLVLANLAYKYCSVAFLQMMKECNIPFVYFLGIACSLDTYDWRRAAMLFFILGAAMNFAAGEVHMSQVGFAIQVCSQFFEVFRITMQTWLLQGKQKVDSLTMLLFMTPCCLVTLIAIAIARWDPAIPGRLVEMWLPVLGNCILAVMLNLGTVLLQQVASASVYVLVGVCKDVVCITLSATLLHDPITPRQVMACMAALSGILLHTAYRTRPELFGQPSKTEPYLTGVPIDDDGDDNNAKGQELEQLTLARASPDILGKKELQVHSEDS